MKIFYILSVISFFLIAFLGQSFTTRVNIEILEGHYSCHGKTMNVIPKVESPIDSKAISEAGILYSGSTGTGGNAYLFIFPSGHIVQGCPTGGLEKFNFNTYCGSQKGSCGTFTKSGNSMNIKWTSGANWKGTIKANGDIEINNTLYGKVQRVPNKLSASYDFTLNSNGVSVAETTKFNDDGTYSISHISGYDHNDGINSAEWQSQSKGKYVITGFTITMINNAGKSTSHTIYSLDSEKNPDFLGWDGNFLSKSGK